VVKSSLNLLILIILGLWATSCSYYRRDILFRAPKEIEESFAKNSKNLKVPLNYRVVKNDYLEFQIFTNKGEVLIDPTSEFSKQITSGAQASGGGNKIRYLVQGDGFVNLPIIGKVKLDSLTLRECDSILVKEYAKFYIEPYVMTKVSNRRIFILGRGVSSSSGASGGGGGGGGGGAGGLIMELENENMTLMEVLAKMGGPSRFSFVDRIKVIRGDLKNPTIFTVDLTRWDSFQKSELIIQPNDIIYVTPGRRATFDALRDLAFLTSAVSTLVTIYLLTQIK